MEWASLIWIRTGIIKAIFADVEKEIKKDITEEMIQNIAVYLDNLINKIT